jgi:hypothetical protein
MYYFIWLFLAIAIYALKVDLKGEGKLSFSLVCLSWTFVSALVLYGRSWQVEFLAQVAKDGLLDRIELQLYYAVCSPERCDACGGPRYGTSYCAIRPISKLLGIKNVPLLFRCCSADCKLTFLSRTDGLMELLYGSWLRQPQPSYWWSHLPDVVKYVIVHSIWASVVFDSTAM